MAMTDRCAKCSHELANHPPGACIGDGPSCACDGFVRSTCASRDCRAPAALGQLHCAGCLRRKSDAAYMDQNPPAWAVEMKKQIDAIGQKLGLT